MLLLIFLILLLLLLLLLIFLLVFLILLLVLLLLIVPISFSSTSPHPFSGTHLLRCHVVQSNNITLRPLLPQVRRRHEQADGLPLFFGCTSEIC